MNSKKRSQFVVRALRAESELTLCLDLDHSTLTEYVWQMDVREEGDEIAVRYRTVRLPRPMDVGYPRDHDSLAQAWERRDCFLVAAADDVVLGYVNLRIDAIRTRGWIQDLVVGKPFRRRRIGRALLEQATRWAMLHQISHLTLEMQTKNYPAIQFARAQGFVFCGFNDHYYMNQDIAVFFGRGV
jgi:ribosomal protein S18 acetylase RimI-like enzyme